MNWACYAGLLYRHQNNTGWTVIHKLILEKMVLVINRETCLLCKTDYGVGAGLNVQRLLLHWCLWAIDFQKMEKKLPTFSKVLAMEKFKTRTSDFCHKVKKGTNSTKRDCLMFKSLWKQHSSDTPVLFKKIPSLYMVALRVCQSQHSQFSLSLSWDLFLRCSHFPEIVALNSKRISDTLCYSLGVGPHYFLTGLNSQLCLI